jgi:hypothetical protein
VVSPHTYPQAVVLPGHAREDAEGQLLRLVFPVMLLHQHRHLLPVQRAGTRWIKAVSYSDILLEDERHGWLRPGHTSMQQMVC